MSRVLLCALVFLAASLPALADDPISGVIDEGPLAPCAKSTDASGAPSTATPPWGIELASGFFKDELFDSFARIKEKHSSLLGDAQPLLIEQCNLSMGTKPLSSVRVGANSVEEADSLCAKLRASGETCLMQRN
jgi:hypothetical protein